MSKELQPLMALTPGGNINAYIQAVNAFPVLTQEREQALGEALYFRDDLAAARELVLAHLRFVVHIARSYSGYGLPLADLVQEGNVGLMKAAEKFDPEAGCRFSTYGTWWIKQSIRRALVNTVPSVRVPGYMAELVSKWKHVGTALSFQMGRAPSVEEVANMVVYLCSEQGSWISGQLYSVDGGMVPGR